MNILFKKTAPFYRVHLKLSVAGEAQPRQTALVVLPTDQFAESEGDNFKCSLFIHSTDSHILRPDSREKAAFINKLIIDKVVLDLV